MTESSRRPGPQRDEIGEELQFHIEGRVEDLVAEGTDEQEARRQVMAAFGDFDRVRSSCQAVQGTRQVRVAEQFENLMREMKVGVRGVIRNVGFTATAVVVLALGIGANIAVFSVVNAVLLRPLPYRDAEHLVRVWPVKNFNISLAAMMADRLPAVESITGLSGWTVRLTGEAAAEELSAGVVSPQHFAVLGAAPALGRVFRREEGFRGASDVVVLSHGLWRRRFGGDPRVIGRRIALDGYGLDTREVIGVMGDGYRDPWENPDLWIPLHTGTGTTLATDSSYYVNRVVGRLADGATTRDATAQLRGLAVELRRDFPAVLDDEEAALAAVVGLQEDVVGDVRTTLWVLVGGVVLVLTIACANVANLVLARGNRRAREMAVRAALGAGRSQLIREQLIESVILAVLGGIVAVAVAAVALRQLSEGAAAILPRGDTIALDWRAMGFAIGISTLSSLAFGFVPALRSTRRAIADALRGGMRIRGGEAGAGVNRALVAVEVAVAMVLVIGAGLVVRSSWRLAAVDPGFDAGDAVVMITAVPGGIADDTREQFYVRLQERLEALPGVERVGGVHLLPLRAGNWSFPYLAEGHEPPSGAPLPSANFRVIVPGYFDAMRIPLLRGRRLGWTDGASAEPVGVINEAMATDLWPGEDAVGKVINLFGSSPFTVVGVVGNVRQFALNLPVFPAMYRPIGQFGTSRIHMIIRPAAGVALSEAALRQTVRSIDPSVPVPEVTTVDAVRGEAVAATRFFAHLLTAFGVLALLLGVAGVFGVTSYVIAARRSEFGLRLALGANPAAIRRFALLDGMRPVAIGLVLGTGLAVALSGALRGLLFEIKQVDIGTYVTVGLGLTVAAAGACFGPAVQASRVDPVKTLSAE